jgi:hypothetical protein
MGISINMRVVRSVWAVVSVLGPVAFAIWASMKVTSLLAPFAP